MTPQVPTFKSTPPYLSSCSSDLSCNKWQFGDNQVHVLIPASYPHLIFHYFWVLLFSPQYLSFLSFSKTLYKKSRLPSTFSYINIAFSLDGNSPHRLSPSFQLVWLSPSGNDYFWYFLHEELFFPITSLHLHRYKKPNCALWYKWNLKLSSAKLALKNHKTTNNRAFMWFL